MVTNEQNVAPTMLTEGRELHGRVGEDLVEGRKDGAGKAVPEDAMIIVPVRNAVAFPGMVAPLSIGRQISIAAVKEAVRTERPIGVLLQRDSSVDHPRADDL